MAAHCCFCGHPTSADIGTFEFPLHLGALHLFGVSSDGVHSLGDRYRSCCHLERSQMEVSDLLDLVAYLETRPLCICSYGCFYLWWLSMEHSFLALSADSTHAGLSKHQSTQWKCHRSSTTRRRSHYLWSQCWSWSYDDWMLSGYHHLLCSSNYISHWEGWASSSFTVDQLWSFHDRHWLLRMSWGISVWRLEPTWRTVRWFARNRSQEGKILQIGHRGFLRYLQENCEIPHLPAMAQWTWGITPQLEVHSQLQSSFGVDRHSFSDCGACCDSQRPFAALDVPTDCGTAQTTYWRWHAWPYGSKIIAVDVWLSERRAGSDWTWLCHLCAILKPTVSTVWVANVTKPSGSLNAEKKAKRLRPQGI